LPDTRRKEKLHLEELKYGNWIRIRVLVILGMTALCLAILTVFVTDPLVQIPIGILALIVFVSFLYPLYAYYEFSPNGGNIQEKLYGQIIDKVGEPVTGKILDIGTGNGILAIRVARAHPGAHLSALDYWGKNWEYSQSVCVENANKARVSNRVTFVKGDAARLNYPDSSFDAVVSNLTFHEVKSVRDKRDVMREALRVLKPGGRFAFIDYFCIDKYYGPLVEFDNFLQGLGLGEIRMEHLKCVTQIPKLLLHPKALGKVGIVYGRK
jgi:SAM-dependent methyltransferase